MARVIDNYKQTKLSIATVLSLKGMTVNVAEPLSAMTDTILIKDFPSLVPGSGQLINEAPVVPNTPVTPPEEENNTPPETPSTTLFPVGLIPTVNAGNQIAGLEIIDFNPTESKSISALNEYITKNGALYFNKDYVDTNIGTSWKHYTFSLFGIDGYQTRDFAITIGSDFPGMMENPRLVTDINSPYYNTYRVPFTLNSFRLINGYEIIIPAHIDLKLISINGASIDPDSIISLKINMGTPYNVAQFDSSYESMLQSNFEWASDISGIRMAVEMGIPNSFYSPTLLETPFTFNYEVNIGSETITGSEQQYDLEMNGEPYFHGEKLLYGYNTMHMLSLYSLPDSAFAPGNIVSGTFSTSTGVSLPFSFTIPAHNF